MAEQEFAGRVVIITGGAGGVGEIVTRRWIDAGASVLVVGSTLHSVNIESKRLASFAADVSTEAGAASMVAHAEQVFGQPADTLIHLAGGFAMGPLDAPDAPDTWEKMMSMNLDAPFYCYRAMLPALRARGGGWIVGLASRAAVAPPAGLAAYAASKAGMIALTQSLAAEVRGENIHVNVILGSTIDTPANRQSMGDSVAGDWVRPDDIADATFYLCSERARAVHGATLEIYANA
jgi:NAD(P)-dependent dehydrogenase (short-subunit alcohol dehydrogenase family)